MFWFDNNLEREQQWQHFRSMNGTKQVIALLLNDTSKQMNLSLLVEYSTSFQSGKSLLCVSRGYS